MHWKSPVAWLLLIWVVGATAYANTFSAPFVFDDLVEITGNQALKSFDVPALLARYPTRIITYLTLAANYAASASDVRGYHLVNLAIHLLTATVIFFLVKELAGATRQRNQASVIAGVTALLFISHPIQTQAVTYIIQRLASLATLFYVLGLFGYVKARSSSASLRVRNWLHVAAFSSIILAMFSKEIAFTAPVAILMIEWCFFRPSSGSRLATSPVSGTEGTSPGVGEGQAENRASFTPGVVPTRNLKQELPIPLQERNLGSVIPFLLLLLVIPLTLWIHRPPLVERETPLSENAAVQPGRPLTAETNSISRHDYVLTQIHVVRTYLRLLILPINQNADYDYPISHSLLETKTAASLLLLLAAAGLGWWLYSKNRLASFGIFFFFLALSVESSFVPIRDVIFEHRLYLPSFGFFLATASGWVWLYQKAHKKTGVAALGIIVILTLAILTYQRNTVWSSAASLWQDVTNKSPHKARGWNNAGVAAIENTAKAESAFRRALELDPAYAEAYNNLGLIKAKQGDYGTALQLFIKATELEPLYVHAFNNLGVVYLQQGKPGEAISPLEMAVGTDDAYLDAKINLAIAYLENANYDNARRQVEIVLEREPMHEEARQLLQQINSEYRKKR